MLSEILDSLPLLIPIIALMIPLVAVTSYAVVQPIVKAIARLAESQQGKVAGPGPDQRILDLEQRVASLERTLTRVVEEQEFHRELRSGGNPSTARLAGDLEGPRP